jgi:hypothetical protein
MAEYGGPAQTAATHYFTTDHLGSTRMILSATGGCVERLDYAPFADQHPEDGQSWNMYAYVRNNPLRYVDPSGTICVSPGGDKPDFDDPTLPGPTCAEIREQDKKWRGSYGATAESDLARGMWEEHKRRQVEARLLAQREAEQRDRDQQLSQNSRAVITVAYYRTAHDLGCAGLGFVAGDAGGALFVSGQPNAGFRSPVSGRLVGGTKPFATPGSSAGSSTLSGALRDTLPQTLPHQVPTPVGGPGTGRAFSMQGSNRLGVVLGRWAPFAGVVGVAYGSYSTYACLSE